MTGRADIMAATSPHTNHVTNMSIAEPPNDERQVETPAAGGRGLETQSQAANLLVTWEDSTSR